jgi:RHS repeat-associated protein
VKKTPITGLSVGQYTLFEPQRISGEDTRSYNKARAFIRLNYSRKLQSDRTHNYDWNLQVDFTYLLNGVSTAGSLIIRNDATSRTYEDYIEIPVADNALGYAITITNVSGTYAPLGGGTSTAVSSPQTSTFIPDDIDLILELRNERVYNLNTAAVLDDISTISFSPSNYKIYWAYQQGAEEYDLEWVFIDKYSLEYTQITNAENAYTPNELSGFTWPFELLEATRVRVWGNSYQLDKTYPEGRLYFRVRSVSTFADQSTGISDDIRLGRWGYFTNTGSSNLNLTKHEITSTIEFEPTKTWLYGVEFADDGRSTNVLAYFDGSNRERQSLTYNASDNITSVGESKYDKEGRKSVSIMPAPVSGRNLLFQNNFNLAAPGNVFDEGEIEQGVVPPLLTTSGAAKYFSKNNDFSTDLFRDAIPNAEGYVFSQTIFRNDGTGRIESMGSAGSDFQATGTHAVRKWYGSTNVAELKRLFGDNVSDTPQGYRKDMSRDENGQLNVTYYDKRGNTIATALAGDAPNSLRKLDYTQESITTPLNENNVQIGNSKISEYTYLNTIPGSTISLDYSMTSIIQQLASQTINVEGYEIPFEAFCADCAYTLRIEVKNQYGLTVGTPIQQSIHAGAPCTAATYSNTGYTVTLPDIGEYRIIKTLTVDEQSMIAAFQAQLDAQGTGSFNAFLSQYLENVDITACITDCEDYCYYKVRLDYLQTHTLAQWNGLLKSQVDAVVETCSSVECDLYHFTENDPIQVDPVQACESQRQRMLHQFSPGGIYYDDPASYLWTGIGSSYGGYTLAQYQDEANFTSAMAVALLPLHKENCMLQNGRCETWMSVQNASFDLTDLIMNTAWPSSATGVFASPYSSSYDPAYNAFGMNVALQTAVNSYATNHPVPLTADCNSQSWSISSGNLYAYVNFIGNRLATAEACAGNLMTVAEIEMLKKRLFLGLYLKIKWDLVSANCGCILLNNQYAVFMIPPNYATMDGIINAALASVANATDCEEVGINNVNHWIDALPVSCLSALGMSNFMTITYPGSQATAMQTAYATNASNPTIAQLFYNYTMATCDATTDPNTFGLFYDPGTGNPGKNWYDAIKAALTVSGCNYASGTMLPFETTAPTGSAVPFSNYNPADLKAAIENLVFQMLSCTSCTETVRDEYQSSLIKFMRVKQMSGVTAGMAAGYTGTVRMVKKWLANQNGVVNTAEGYRYYFDMTITNGTCTFNLPLNTQSPLGHDGNGYVFAGNFHFRINDPIPNATSIAAIVDYLDVSLNNSNLVMTWDCLVGTFNGQNVQFLNTGVLAECAGPSSVGFDLGSIYEDLQNLGFNQTDDCIQSQLQQAAADAQVLYNQVIEGLWSDFYKKMKSCLNVTENFKMTHTLKEYQYTLYYYDLAGNLVQTVPPQGVHPFNQTQVNNCLLPNNAPSFPAHDMETRYMYNGLNAIITNYTPDGGRLDLFLDKLYRVRFSQNAQQVQDFKASYSNYDELGRVVEAGEFRKGNSDNLTARTDDPGYPFVGIILDYTHTFYESAYIPPVTAVGYTPYPSANAPDGTLTAAFGTEGQQNLRNSIGAVMHRQADFTPLGILIPGTEVISIISYSYDPHKNVKRVVSTNSQLAGIGMQHKVIDYTNDLIAGNIHEMIYQEGTPEEYRYRYHYDLNNRIERAYTSHNGNFWELDAKYFYYLHGVLARRELGNDQVQGTDYAQNLKGFHKGVNSNTLDRTRDIGKDGNTGTDNQYFGIDAFGYSLGYFTNDYQTIKDAAESTQNYLNDYFAGTAAVTSQNLNPDASNASMASLYNGNITNMVTALRDVNEAKLDILSNNYQYDQLQRIREMKVYNATGLQTNNDFTGASLYHAAGSESAFQESYTFDKNGNLRTMKRNGSGRNALNNTIPLAMDNFTYYYQTAGASVNDPTIFNRLKGVTETVPAANYTGDIDPGQNSNANYSYNSNGQLISDVQENIQTIEWTVTGKVKKITFTAAGKTAGKRDVKFIYNAMDQRIAKLVYTNTDNSRIDWTYYNYDANGDILTTETRVRRYTSSDATYNYYTDSYSLNEHFIYATGRLGVEKENLTLFNKSFRQSPVSASKDVELAVSWQVYQPGIATLADYTQRVVGDKRYELSNHLGNVLAVITDRKVRYTDNGTLVYTADVVSYSDYSPYGTILDNRHGNDNTYRYGFQGQERDDEIKGVGNSYNYEYRMHDPRLGRFFAEDPLADKYPHNSPYAFSENMVIHMVELEGLESAPHGFNRAIDEKEGDVFIQEGSHVEPFNAPNGQMVSGTENDGMFFDTKLKEIAWLYGGEDVGWLSLGFKTQSGETYMWNSDKSWYVNSKGEEFDDGLSFDITNCVGGAVSAGVQAFIDKVEKDDAFYTFNKAWDAHGGSLGDFLWSGLSQTVSTIGEGGHKGTQALGSAYAGFLMGGGAVTTQGPMLIYNGALRGAPKASLGMKVLGGASANLNYYTGLARSLGYSGTTTRTAAGVFVQINHGAARILSGRMPNLLYSSNLPTVIGRGWQNQSIFMGLGLGAYGTFSTFMPMTYPSSQSSLLGLGKNLNYGIKIGY